jgi:hypothetical protein
VTTPKGPGGFIVIISAIAAITSYFGAVSFMVGAAVDGFWSVTIPWLVPPMAAGLVLGAAQTTHHRNAFDILPSGIAAVAMAYLVLTMSPMLDGAKNGPIGMLAMASFVLGMCLATSPLILLGAFPPAALASVLRRHAARAA